MSSAAAQVRTAVEPALTAEGFHVEDVEVRQAGSRRLVQVLVDRDDRISLDQVAEASRLIAAVLDGVDVLPGAYVLEVSSPGVDRPLTLPRHWRRNAGRLVSLTPVDGAAYAGRVLSADDDAVLLDVAGEQRRVELSAVRSAVVQVEFNRPDAADEEGSEGE